METSPEHNPKQANQPEPTVEETKEWGDDELLKWIQQKQPKLLRGDDLENFKAAHIPGQAFLMEAGNVKFFQKECDLSIGPSLVLAALARGIVEGKTAGIKRHIQQAEDVEIYDPASKKPRLESEADGELQMLAINARQQRERIRQVIRGLDQSSVSSKDVVPPPRDVVPPSKDVDPRYNSVFQLSNPTFDTKLPFPFVGKIVPDRFRVDGKDNEKNWFYMGREKFADILGRFEKIRDDSRYSDLIIYGTRGYGKSHLLAALVCYWAARDEKVVYIPDCRYLIKDPVEHIKWAMLFAWADDESKQQTIIGLNTPEEIYRFFRAQKDVIFVIDQLNALQQEDDNPYTADKADLYKWLERYRAGAQHKAILSSSANNHSILKAGGSRQDNTDRMDVYGGLTRKEMDHWWGLRKEVALGDYTQDEVEDFTGCIPWFLENCVMDGKIDLITKFFNDINTEAAAFEQGIQTQYEDKEGTLIIHFNYIKACLFGLTVPPLSKDMLDLIDHRYFYSEFDSECKKSLGHYTCGICRKAVAPMILENRTRFDNKLLQLLPKYINNPSVTRFIIEQAVLSSIALKGLNITSELNDKMDVTPFEGDVPPFDITKKKPTLYIPKAFNFRNIDGIIALIAPKPRTENKKQELFVYPLQITLAPDKHKISREKFFGTWETWTESLEQFDVVPEFVWISPNETKTIKHDECPQWPAHTEQYVPISHVNREIWSWYEKGKSKRGKQSEVNHLPKDDKNKGAGRSKRGKQSKVTYPPKDDKNKGARRSERILGRQGQ